MKRHARLGVCFLMIIAATLHAAEDSCSAQEPKARATLQTHTPRKVVFGADGRMLISSSFDGTIMLWDVASGKEMATFNDPPGEGRRLSSVAITADGKTLASLKEGGTITIWDVATGKPRATLQGGRETIRSLAISADGKTLVSGDEDGTVKVWDMATGQERATLQASSRSQLKTGGLLFDGALRVNAVLFSPDDKVFAVASGPTPTDAEHGIRAEIRLWETATLKELCTLATNQLDIRIALTSDGKTLASGSRPGNIKLWNVATGKELVSLTDHEACQAVAFSRDGKVLLSASSAGTIKWWDVATGKEQGILNTHRNGPHAVPTGTYVFSPDNKHLATVAEKTGVIEFWDVPEAPR